MHRKERFQNNYDLLRLLAAFSIVFYHSFVLSGVKYEEPLIRLSGGRLDTAFLGLSVFFSISGYLIAKSAVRSPTIVNYLWKRLLRIQPLLLVTCIFTVIIGGFFTILSLKNYVINPQTWSYFRNVMPVFGLQYTLPGVFVHNPGDIGVNGSIWTLVVEERLYLFMCIVFLLRKKFRDYFVWFVLVPNVFYIINRFYYSGEIIPFLSTRGFFYALIFLNSAALYFLKVKFSKSLFWYIFLSAIVFSIAVFFPNLDFLYFFSIPVFVNAIAQIKGFTNYAGKYGDFTYSIYVFSFPVQQMFIAKGIFIKEPYGLFFVTIVILFPAAVLSWNLIEKKFLKMKKDVGMHRK